MGFLIECVICGLQIDSTYLTHHTESWKAEYLSFRDITPRSILSDNHDQPYQPTEYKAVHRICWRVLKNEPLIHCFTQDELTTFWSRLIDLMPLRSCETKKDTPNYDNTILPTCTGSLKNHVQRLPTELLLQIVSLLNSRQDVRAILASDLLYADQAAAVAHAVRVFELSEPSYEALHETYVRERIDSLLEVRMPLHGQIVEDIHEQIFLTMPHNRFSRYNVPMFVPDGAFYLTVFSHNFLGQCYLCGLQIANQTYGRRGNLTFNTEVKGIQLLRFWFDVYGVRELQVKDTTGWHDRLGGFYSKTKKKLTLQCDIWYAETTCSPNMSLNLILDELKIVAVSTPSVTSATNIERWIWKANLSMSDLSLPTGLKIISPCVWERLPITSTLVVFSVYVTDADANITGIEIQDSHGALYAVGVRDASVVKLSLHIASSLHDGVRPFEKLQSLRVSPNQAGDSLALELKTSYRTFNVGQVDSGAHVWDISHDTEVAIAFASRNEYSTPLWQNVIFFGSNVAPAVCSRSNMLYHTYTADDILSAPARLFESYAEIESIREILQYSPDTNFSTICGLRLLYRNGSVSLLGEDRVPGAEEVLASTERINEIFVHRDVFGSKRRIRGLKFILASGRVLRFGHPDDIDVERIHISDDSRQLVWSFDQCTSSLDLVTDKGSSSQLRQSILDLHTTRTIHE